MLFRSVDVLNLTVGTVRYMDLKKLNKNREFKPDLRNQIFKDVKTTADLYGILTLIWLRSGGGSLGRNGGRNLPDAPGLPLTPPTPPGRNLAAKIECSSSVTSMTRRRFRTEARIA